MKLVHGASRIQAGTLQLRLQRLDLENQGAMVELFFPGFRKSSE
jgi:hypothetical protein